MSMSPSQNRSFSSLRASDKVVKAAGALKALNTNADIMEAMGPRHYTAVELNADGEAIL